MRAHLAHSLPLFPIVTDGDDNCRQKFKPHRETRRGGRERERENRHVLVFLLLSSTESSSFLSLPHKALPVVGSVTEGQDTTNFLLAPSKILLSCVIERVCFYCMSTLKEGSSITKRNIDYKIERFGRLRVCLCVTVKPVLFIFEQKESAPVVFCAIKERIFPRYYHRNGIGTQCGLR